MPNSNTTDRIDVGSRLQLNIWHPDCWTLEVTANTAGGLLGHGVHRIDGMATGRFTAYARSTADLETLVDAIEASSLVDSVWSIDQHRATAATTPRTENATTGLIVQYDLANSINDALVSRGFIPDEPVRITGGREYWTVVTHENRDTVRKKLDEIRDEQSASITVELMTALRNDVVSGMFRTDRLSERQREVFELARSRHYYRWPREVSAADLAAELEIAESTFLEHLRKAEAKLLDRPE
ncbi:helix-turn-helix domain-containing protein [Natronorubrum thiooxidans]|uniref:Predicted DNA binding protein, contains HTH domain n=1 Tax=Natronorubrum thiooxidans TaxID=308853 RepID=A0A1N7CMQ9_9EURY|nr:helix-turn-helix domain-containing protein [Natronorubrum thiooxidans]SIR64840.1 Predicted DNA binding protein, contains HTH domain [Natronorubrum thiooxidans]